MSLSKYTPSSSSTDALKKDFISNMGNLDEITTMALKQDVEAEPLSILVISNQLFCERLKMTMSKLSEEKYEGKILIKLAECAEQICESGLEATSIDYVAIVCDTGSRNFREQVLEELKNLDAIAPTKLCLVNGTPKTGLEGSAEELVRIAVNSSLLYMNGQIMEDAGCKRIAERIIALATSCCGYYTGVPFIFPTPIEFFLQMESES